MNVKDILNYLEENDRSFELLTDEQIIESVMGTHKENEVEDDSVKLEQVSHKDILKSNNLLTSITSFCNMRKLHFIFFKVIRYRSRPNNIRSGISGSILIQNFYLK